jgi:hypothetical protein
MKIISLTCPSCGSPIGLENVHSGFAECGACRSTLYIQQSIVRAIACPHCRTINKPNEKFCRHCGKLLLLACPFCYTTNRIDAPSCFYCGKDLQEIWKTQSFWNRSKAEFDADHRNQIAIAKEIDRKAEIRRVVRNLDNPEYHETAEIILADVRKEELKEIGEGLQDLNANVRLGIVKALANIKLPQSVVMLVEALDDPEPVVRYQAIDSIARINLEMARTEIEQLREDPDDRVRRLVATILA